MDVQVYDRLIEAVHSYMKEMYRYLELRRKILNLTNCTCTTYVPLVRVPGGGSYEKAQEQVLEPCSPWARNISAFYKRVLAGGG